MRGLSLSPRAPKNSGSPWFGEYGLFSKYASMHCQIIGNSGTIRSLLPLPRMRKNSLWAFISPTLSDRASEMRRPQPYSRVKIARSRRPCQGLAAMSLTSSRTVKESFISSALGRILALCGDEITLMAGFLIILLVSSQRKKFLTAESSRLIEEGFIFLAARLLKKRRKSRTSSASISFNSSLVFCYSR